MTSSRHDGDGRHFFPTADGAPKFDGPGETVKGQPAAGRPASDLDEWPQPKRQLLAGPGKGSPLLLVCALHLGWVVEAPVEGVLGTRKDRTRLARPVAHSDDVVELIIGKLLNRLRE